MIKIRAKVVGAAEVIASLKSRRIGVLRATARELDLLGNLLLRKVKAEKLNGQVLNRRSAVLGNSVNREPRGGVQPAARMAVSVGSNVWYGRMWELTGHKEILPVKARILAWQRPRGVWHRAKRVAPQAPRPWLRPALDEMKPIAVRRLNAAIQAAMAKGR